MFCKNYNKKTFDILRLTKNILTGNLDLLGHHCVVRMDNNPWVPPIADQLQLGVTHVIEYIRSDTYK